MQRTKADPRRPPPSHAATYAGSRATLAGDRARYRRAPNDSARTRVPAIRRDRSGGLSLRRSVAECDTGKALGRGSNADKERRGGADDRCRRVCAGACVHRAEDAAVHRHVSAHRSGARALFGLRNDRDCGGATCRDYERTALAAEARREAATAAAPDEVHAMGESLQTSSTAILNRPPPTFSPPSPARPDWGHPTETAIKFWTANPVRLSTILPPARRLDLRTGAADGDSPTADGARTPAFAGEQQVCSTASDVRTASDGNFRLYTRYADR